MRITKVLNNNTLLCRPDAASQEVVVMGKGLGFGARVGQLVNLAKVERVFSSTDQEELRRQIHLLHSIPSEFFEISADIVEKAKRKLARPLNENLLFTLADHLYFAVAHLELTYNISTLPLLWEIRQFYAAEAVLATDCIDGIEEKMGVRLPDSEIVSISMHIINAELSQGTDSRTLRAAHSTKLIAEFVEQLGKRYALTVDELSNPYFLVLVQSLKSIVELHAKQKATVQDENAGRETAGEDAKQAQAHRASHLSNSDSATQPEAFATDESVKKEGRKERTSPFPSAAFFGGQKERETDTLLKPYLLSYIRKEWAGYEQVEALCDSLANKYQMEELRQEAPLIAYLLARTLQFDQKR